MSPYQKELLQLVGGQIHYAGVNHEGYPYLILVKPQSDQVFYVIAQCDAEGNGPGFLQLTQRHRQVASMISPRLQMHPHESDRPDVSLTQLIDTLGNLSDPDFDVKRMHLSQQEVEDLAALLIQGLANSLDGQLIASLLHRVRNSEMGAVIHQPILRSKLRHRPLVLPTEFPKQVASPMFHDGDRVRWLPVAGERETDRGTIIGRFFAYASHQRDWTWMYVVWLNEPDGETFTDTAWEDDLQRFD